MRAHVTGKNAIPLGFLFELGGECGCSVLDTIVTIATIESSGVVLTEGYGCFG